MSNSTQMQSINYNLFSRADTYKSNSNLFTIWKAVDDYMNGKQFIEEGDNTNIQTISVNLVRSNVNTIVSKITSSPVYLKFVSPNKEISNDLTNYDRYVMDRTAHEINQRAVALDGYKYNKGILHIVWDEDFCVYKGIYKGGIREEVISPFDFAVANPYLDNLQAQKWIIHRVYMDLEQIKALVRSDNEEKDSEYIIGTLQKEEFDTKTNKNASTISEDHAYVYFRYFRVNGEVFYMASTKTINLLKYPRALNPKISNSSKIFKDLYKKNKNKELKDDIPDMNIDWEDVLIPTTNLTIYSDEEYQKDKNRFSLYPFADFTPEPISGAFYGNSFAFGLIKPQNNINYILTMVGKNIELMAFPKMLAKRDALIGPTTGEIGEIIYDNTIGNSWGVSYLNPPTMNNQAFTFADWLLSYTTKYSGLNDNIQDVVNGGDSGYKYQLALNDQNSTLVPQQKMLWEFEKNSAQIRLLYYKFYMGEVSYLQIFNDDDLEVKNNYREKEISRAMRGKSELFANEQEARAMLDKPSEAIEKTISSEQIYNEAFDINVEAIQGVRNSQLAESQYWQTILLNGSLQNISPDTLALWIEYSPDLDISRKQRLKSAVNQIKQSKITELQNQVVRLTQLVQQMGQATEGYKVYNNNLTKEFTDKINTANKMITDRDNIINQYNQGQVKSNSARGISSNASNVNDLSTSL